MPNPESEIVGGVRVADAGRQTRGVALAFHPNPRHRDVGEPVERGRPERRATQGEDDHQRFVIHRRTLMQPV